MNQILITIFVLITYQSLSGQILSTRNLIAVPELNSEYAGKLLNKFDLGAEIAVGGGSAGAEMAWTYKLHGYADIYRFAANSSIGFLISHELNANPHNDINFNPRKAIWEENFRYYYTGKKISWMAGFYHRCKHDIDNSFPPRENMYYRNYTPTNRIIVLTGLNAAIYHSADNKKQKFNQMLKAEYYLYSGDGRSPYPRDSATWDELVAAVRWSGNWNYYPGGIFSLRLFTGIGASILNSDKPSKYDFINIDYRLEIAVAMKGKNNYLELFWGYEKMFDETVFIYPVATKFWNAGLRLRPGIFR